jgi:putative MATE family efflux protein
MRSPLDDRRIGLLLFKLSLPAFIGMFVMTIYNVVDTIFVGHWVGPEGIGALSLVFPLQMFFVGVGQMIGLGASSIISRSIGARDLKRAHFALGNAFLETLFLSGCFLLVGVWKVDWLGLVLGTSASLLPYVKDYMGVIIWGSFVQVAPLVFGTLIRAEGNAIVPAISMVGGALLNVGLDALFVIKMHLGVKGAALATVISQIVSTIWLFSYYLFGKSFIKLKLWALRPHGDVLFEMNALGVSAFLRTLAGSFSAVMVNRMAIIYGGDLAVSAFGILNRLAQLAIMPIMALGQGLMPVLGFNYGASRPKEALRSIWLSLMASEVICSFVFFLIFFWPDPLIRMFTSEEELIKITYFASRKMFLALYLVGLAIVGSFIFQAMGKAREAFITSVSRPLLFTIPSVLLLPKFLGIQGVWLTFPISDVLSTFLTLILLLPHLKRFKEKAIKVQK